MNKKNKTNGSYLEVSVKKYKKLRIDNFFSGINGRIDEGALSPAAAALSYNFDFSSGALKDGPGVADAGISGFNAAYIWRFIKNIDGAGEIIMFAGLLGDIYYIKNGVQPLHIRIKGRVYTRSCRLHGDEVILMWSEESPLAVWDGVNPAYFVADTEVVKSVDTLGELTFIAETDGQTVRYTDEPDPVNWYSEYYGGGNGGDEASGFFTPAEGSGRIGKILSFMGYLYVFKDYCVSRISINGAAVKPSGSFTFGGRIFFDTVAVCGSKIMFLCGDGLYEFDGLNVKRVLSNLTGIIPAASSAGAYHGGKYYLAAKYDVKDGQRTGCETGEYVNNALIVYCPSDGGYTLSRGIDITDIAAGDDDVYVVSGGAAGKIVAGAACFGTPLVKFYKSPLTDLGSEKTKVLKEIHIDTSGAVILTVYSGLEKKSFNLEGSDQPQKIRVGLRGKKIGFSTESRTAGARIGRIVLIYSECSN